MVDVIALLFVLILSVALAMGAAFLVLGGLLNMMRRTAVRLSRDAVGSSANLPLDAPVQRVRRYPLAHHDGAGPLVIRGAA
jgi:hypothetical protein